jgi:hypothetical protein
MEKEIRGELSKKNGKKKGKEKELKLCKGKVYTN